MSEALKPCPFCGGEAEIERHGGRRFSTIVACIECGCRLESGEVHTWGSAWNTRALSTDLVRAGASALMDALRKVPRRREKIGGQSYDYVRFENIENEFVDLEPEAIAAIVARITEGLEQ